MGDGSMNKRQRLHNRRASDTFEIRHGNFTYTITASIDAKGRLGELFIDSDKSGTELSVMMHDAAIAVSLALQNGCPPEDLAQAFERNEAGVPAGLLGMALDRAIAMTRGKD